MTKISNRILHKKISGHQPETEKPKDTRTAKEKGREVRVNELIRMKNKEFRALAKSLGLRRVEYKRYDKENPVQSKNRSKEDQARLVFEKELELDR